jgi:hypothetical protein
VIAIKLALNLSRKLRLNGHSSSKRRNKEELKCSNNSSMNSKLIMKMDSKMLGRMDSQLNREKMRSSSRRIKRLKDNCHSLMRRDT